jgi:hypothetical protein
MFLATTAVEMTLGSLLCKGLLLLTSNSSDPRAHTFLRHCLYTITALVCLVLLKLAKAAYQAVGPGCRAPVLRQRASSQSSCWTKPVSIGTRPVSRLSSA